MKCEPKALRLYAEHVGEIRFDGVLAVISRLDTGYPEIKRVLSQSSYPYSARTVDVRVGAGEVCLEGYLLDASLAPALAAPQLRAVSVGELRSLLCAICAPGREFILEVGGRHRALYASELSFESEPPFGTGTAEKFRLRAFSDDPFFRGGEVGVCGRPATAGELCFPASGEFVVSEERGTTCAYVRNDGDECCGFIAEVEFTVDAPQFVLLSNREEGGIQLFTSFSAGERVTIDTRRDHLSVTRGDGTNLIPLLNDRCVFHTLPPGDTELTLRTFGSAAPVLGVHFTPGYLTV